MKNLRRWLALAIILSAISSHSLRAQQPQPPSPRTIDLKSSDGTSLKATFFPAANPGPAVILFHQSNRSRKSWDNVAHQLAAAGIHTLTIDERGYGDSAGKKEDREQYHAATAPIPLRRLVR